MRILTHQFSEGITELSLALSLLLAELVEDHVELDGVDDLRAFVVFRNLVFATIFIEKDLVVGKEIGYVLVYLVAVVEHHERLLRLCVEVFNH